MEQIFFAPIQKVDASTRRVTGILCSETLDKKNHIMDYARSKPNFVTWSDELKKNSDGKNLGNVRAMHQKHASGRLVDIKFDDEAKIIYGTAEIDDDQDWVKVQKGTYTGFSIGGDGKFWDDPLIAGARRYEAMPTEVSLADNPMNKDATFLYIEKAADGTEIAEERPFEKSMYHVTTLADLLASIESDVRWNLMPEAERESLVNVGEKIFRALKSLVKIEHKEFKATAQEAAVAKSTDGGNMEDTSKQQEPAAPALVQEPAVTIEQIEKTVADTIAKAMDAFREEQNKSIGPINEAIGTLTRSVSQLAGMPMPSKVVTTAVEKAQDSAPITEKKEDAKVDPFVTAFSNPMPIR